MTVILGISALFHDSAAALIVDGQLRAAVQEERLSRKKQDGSVPWRALRASLDMEQMSIADIDCLAYYEDPTAKTDRQLSMLSTEYRNDVASKLISRIDADTVHQALREELGYDGPVRIVPHHLSHAASAYYFSGFEESAILVLDAVGEWSTASEGHGSSRSGIRLWEVDRFPHSLGMFYSTVTSYIGFEVNEGEYKTMGLSPLGKPSFVDQLRQLIHCDDNGGVRLDLSYFDFLGLDRMWSHRLIDLIGKPPRDDEDEIEDWHADMARSAQVILEDIALQKARGVKERTGAADLCMAGGVALNCVMTAKIRESGLFRDIFVQPAAGDAGGSVGAAAQVSADLGSPPPVTRMTHAYLGPEFSTGDDVIPVLKAANVPFIDHRGRFDDLLADVADRLAAGQVVGWFQGRMEFGPRALGSRSILADPRDAGMRDRINGLVKMREPFRPFAPSVLLNQASDCFICEGELPFMLETVQTKVDWLPSVTHVDGSARLQTVNPHDSPAYAALLEAFRVRTGCPVLLNTSFNQRGEPIVHSPADALGCFVRSKLDALAIGEVVIDSGDIPDSLRDATAGQVQRSKRPGLSAYQLA